DIARGNINTIAKKLHIPVLEAKNYAEAIKTLQPVPINGFGEVKKTYLIPDIVIENTGTGWRIFLNDEWMRNYAVNDYYLKMMQESKDAELTAY
ncbi:RNA polymerase sigma-54 factor, partial [Romboutsia ilealis]|nr:RNA polymerase sigma-54 factor [Romboutsia ilealis]